MIEKIYDDYRISYKVQSNGWVNATCPYCGDTGEHLGCPPDFILFNCWRCGRHPAWETLSMMLHIPVKDIPKMLEKYEGAIAGPKVRKEPLVSINPFKYPNGTKALNQYHERYLKKRKFDPGKIVEQWGVLGTGPISRLDKIDYRNRLVIPINWDGQPVSFQARDITGKSDLKYIACPKARERREHQTILYGNQGEWERTRVGIIVEGVTDVWRLGTASAAVFGIDFKLEQVMAIAKAFDRIHILFDTERVAQRQASKLSSKLRMLGKEVHLETLEGGDPGEMEQQDADHLVRQLLNRVY